MSSRAWRTLADAVLTVAVTAVLGAASVAGAAFIFRALGAP